MSTYTTATRTGFQMPVLTYPTGALAPIISQGRQIVLFPDRDGIQRWIRKANELQYPNLHLNTQAVRDWWKPEDGEKADIADVILRLIRDGRQTKI